MGCIFSTLEELKFYLWLLKSSDSDSSGQNVVIRSMRVL